MRIGKVMSRINFRTNASRLLFRVRVEGESCWPELVPGKKYWATSLGKPQIGDYVVFKNPRNPQEVFVKKVVAIKNGAYGVTGTVSWAASSRDFGDVPRESVLGRLLVGEKR